MTLEQEGNLVQYIVDSIDEYVRTIDWSSKRDYNKELDGIKSIIKKFGFGESDYYIGLFGDTEKPLALIVLFRGKADPSSQPEWKFVWPLNVPNNTPPPDSNKTKKRFGI